MDSSWVNSAAWMTCGFAKIEDNSDERVLLYLLIVGAKVEDYVCSHISMYVSYHMYNN